MWILQKGSRYLNKKDQKDLAVRNTIPTVSAKLKSDSNETLAFNTQPNSTKKIFNEIIQERKSLKDILDRAKLHRRQNKYTNV